MSAVSSQETSASIRIECLPADGMPRLSRHRYFVDRIETRDGCASGSNLHVCATHDEALAAAQTYGLPIDDTTVRS